MVVVAQELRDKDEALHQLKLHLTKAQEPMKRTNNTLRHGVQFEVGDWAYLKLRPQRKQSIAQCITNKLVSCYYGPFQVAEKLGPITDIPHLPPDSKFYPVFHVSLLKRVVVTYTIDVVLPKEFTL